MQSKKANTTDKSKDRLAYIDFDGEPLNAGHSYREYKSIDRKRSAAKINPCKHRKVAVTMRCASGCHEVKVYFVKGMVKLKGSLNG